MTDTETAAVLRLFGLSKLEDATRETWPWWGHPEYGLEYGREVPVIPDFHNNRLSQHIAAAVKLAEKMGQSETLCIAVLNGEWSIPYRHRCSVSGTLGSALLAALTAPEEKSRG